MKLQCSFIAFFMMYSLVQAQNQFDTVQINIGSKAKVLLISDDLTDFDSLRIDPRLRNQEQPDNKSLDAYLDEAKRQMGGSFGRKKENQSIHSIPDSLRRILSLDIAAGVSFVQQSTVPTLQVGFEMLDPKRKGIKGLFLKGQGLFFFSKDGDNKSVMDVNYFVVGGIVFDRFNRNAYFGLGYLVKSNGDYFAKNTWKLFTSITVSKDLPIMIIPELIVDSQFKGVYPSVGLQIIF